MGHATSAEESRVDATEPFEAVNLTLGAFDERLVGQASHERHLYLPTRIVGECDGDHLRRMAPLWTDLPDVLPLGEEGGTAWTPDNSWLREEIEEIEEIGEL